jgi:class 3 adenylate cyclase/GAF domain-containing protein
MNLGKWINKFSIESQGLYYKLMVVFGLFFLVPVLGFLYFAVKYDILNDAHIPFYFIALLLFSFFGLIILRKLFDGITSLSRSVSKTLSEGSYTSPEHQGPGHQGKDELDGIVTAFRTIEHELKDSFRRIEKKTSEISTLKELSDLCYMTFNADDLLYITLERALKLIGADIGSVMIIEKPRRDAFIIEASIGLGDAVKKGDRIPFADSIAKHAVINKAPLLVEDIETDIRFGRQSNPNYMTRSFICMPLKAISEVIGVLTISRRKTEQVFTQADVDVLTSLVSNAAFTYDNLRLLAENEGRAAQITALENLSSLISSSLRGSELYSALLQEIQAVLPFDLAVILTLAEGAPLSLRISDVMARTPTSLNKGQTYPVDETILGRVVKQQRTVVLHGADELAHPVEKDLFADYTRHSLLLTPLKEDGNTTGILALYNVPKTSLENSDKLIETMAGILSRSIEKEKILIAFARRNKEMETLGQIGSALAASTFDMDKVLRHTLEMIQAIMDVEAGSLLLLNKNELEFKTSFNLDSGIKDLKAVRLNIGQGIAGYCAARGEPMIVKNVKESKYFHAGFDQMTGFETKSILCVPLISLGKVLGVVEVINKRHGEFDQDDLHLLQSIATTVSIAMENARLYSETLTMAENERGIRSMFQKFVPKEVVDQIMLGGAAEKPLIDEMKILTLLNIDIRGYSGLSQKIGPQKTVAILNYFFSIMGEIVFKHQGIVDKYLGDGFLALFGAPVSRPADADHAISAALEMQRSMEGVNAYVQQRFGVSLTMGVSVHTGNVVVGNIGFDKKMDYTVIGDSVNVAFRLQSFCKSWPNGILISEKTYYAAQSDLDAEEIGLYESGNGDEKMKIYRLLGVRNTVS